MTLETFLLIVLAVIIGNGLYLSIMDCLLKILDWVLSKMK